MEFCKSLEELIKVKQNPSWYYISELILSYQQHANYKIIHQDFVILQLRKYFKYTFMQKEPLTPFNFDRKFLKNKQKLIFMTLTNRSLGYGYEHSITINASG